MKRQSYTERQIEVANILRSVSSEGVSDAEIEEIIQIISDAEQTSNVPAQAEKDTDLSIKIRLLDEADWRKRAALSALLISRSFD